MRVILGLSLVALLSPRPAAAQMDHAKMHPGGGHDSSFKAMQERGKKVMGVDQYLSQHVFDTLGDGGRIVLEMPSGDSAAVATIRAHLQDITARFGRGDFSLPGMVHDEAVPGTKVMAEKRGAIDYRYEALPKGGQVRLKTKDRAALAAIRDFLAYQRSEHHAPGKAP